jgi:flagellar biosynthesis GTPase FlhF
MQLKRILAKDSRTAMDLAMARYGKDVLVVSSQSVAGQIELVVALDVAPQPAPAPGSGKPCAPG